jgi:pimeloyl-ACP methyl ester carboxylesterase
MASAPSFLTRRDGAKVAYNRLAGGSPGVIFLHGLMSDRGGTKAMVLEAHCAARGLGYVRFDMFGHGDSAGRFEDGSVSRWVEDAVTVIDELTHGPQVLVGSSMGGWVMLKTALARPDRVAAMVGVAVAPDFTEELMWAEMTDAQRKQLMDEGVVELPSEYEGPYRIGRPLIEDGRKNLLLGGPIAIDCPARFIHGQQDTSVPWQTSLRVAEKLSGGDVRLQLVKDGDHRLSRTHDLAAICALVDEAASRVNA